MVTLSGVVTLAQEVIYTVHTFIYYLYMTQSMKGVLQPFQLHVLGNLHTCNLTCEQS